MSDFLGLAEQTARAAGALLRDKLSGPRTIRHKGAIDLVTDADGEAEALILQTLARDVPSHAVVAEESGVHGSSDHVWYVDPLDGTSNYAHGVPQFAVSIALYVGGVAEVGVVYDPMRDECFSAARGRGATLNGVPCRISTITTLRDAMLATGFPYWLPERPDPLLQLFGEFAKSAQSLRRFGSAALDLAWVAAGRFDGFFELGLKSWDVAAGALLIAEAGGRVTSLSGAPLALDEGNVLTANPVLHEQLRAVVARVSGLA